MTNAKTIALTRWTFVGKVMSLLFNMLSAAAKSLQSCPTLRDPMDCSLPGSSIHGVFQARVLERGAIAFSDDQPRQHIKKQRHYFANKVHLIKAVGLPVVMHACESWTIKKAEHKRINTFTLWF